MSGAPRSSSSRVSTSGARPTPRLRGSPSPRMSSADAPRGRRGCTAMDGPRDDGRSSAESGKRHAAQRLRGCPPRLRMRPLGAGSLPESAPPVGEGRVGRRDGRPVAESTVAGATCVRVRGVSAPGRHTDPECGRAVVGLPAPRLSIHGAGKASRGTRCDDLAPHGDPRAVPAHDGEVTGRGSPRRPVHAHPFLEERDCRTVLLGERRSGWYGAFVTVLLEHLLDP